MKILLVNPSFQENNPISILDMSSYLRGYGIDVAICHFGNLKKKPYDVVGLSCLGPFKGESIKQLRSLKNFYDSSKIVVGGKWTKTMMPSEKSEISAMGIEIVDISGETYFTKNEIDYVNYPSWNQDEFKTFCNNDYMMSSRGCPFHCNFCNNTESRISYFSPKRTVDIIEMMLKKIGSVFFVDDVLVLNPNHMESILQECRKRNIKIEEKNHFFVHVNLVNDKTIDLIKKYHPSKVQIGIESGDNRMLSEMGKNTNVEKITEAIKKLSEVTKINALWLLGFPGETTESLENTYKLVIFLKKYIYENWFSFYQPVYNTIGYKKCIEEGGVLFQSGANRDVSYIPSKINKEILLDYDRKMHEVK